MVITSSFLSKDKTAVLNKLLENSESLNFKGFAKQYESTFQGEELELALSLHSMELNAEHEVDGHIRGIVALYLLSLVAKGKESTVTGGMACPVTAAKTTIHRLLQNLESNLREDSKRAEQWRMRASSKESSTKSKTAGKDAGLADAMRFRQIQKAFAFMSLLNKVDPEQTPLGILSLDQGAVETKMEQFATQNGQELKDLIKDLAVAADSEPLSSFGTLKSKSVRALQLPAVDSELHYPQVSMLVAPAAPLAPFPSEYRQLLAHSASHLLLLDTEPHTKEWMAAKDILTSASNQAISTNQQNTLISHFTSGAVSTATIGLSPAVYCAVVEKNPSLAVQLVPHLVAPAGYIVAALSTAKMEISTMNQIMAQSLSFLKHPMLSKYVTAVQKKLETTQDKTAAVKGFAVTLHDLVSKKPDGFTAADKLIAGMIFKDYTSLAEVKEHWSSVVATE